MLATGQRLPGRRGEDEAASVIDDHLLIWITRPDGDGPVRTDDDSAIEGQPLDEWRFVGHRAERSQEVHDVLLHRRTPNLMGLESTIPTCERVKGASRLSQADA